jgi:hypothetical protein
MKEFDLIGMTAAAKFLGCDRHTISKRIKQGYWKEGVHFSKFGRSHLFSSKALTEWLKIPSAKRKVKG